MISTADRVHTFTIDEERGRLFVTAKKDNCILAYAIAEDGTLTETGFRYETTEPDNITFFCC